MHRRARLATRILLAVLAAAASAAGPLPPIAKGGIAVTIASFVTVPASQGSPPLARLNLLTHAGDGSGRMFVNDMRGKIWVIQNGQVLPVPFLDATTALGGSLVTSGLQLGLSTFAFHPGYATLGDPGYGLVYTVTHETTSSGTANFIAPTTPTFHNVISEWHVNLLDPNRLDTTRRQLLRIEGFSGDHPMGQIAFNPNLASSHPDFGLLYAALGDGGGYIASAGQEINPFQTAQNRTDPYGDILRIDPHGTSTPQHPTNGQYGIPPSNPYYGAGGGILEEIWAFGLRNPHRFGWDEGGAGKMLISDIGQAQIEEVDLGAAGANYGWRERQGTYVLDPFNENAVLPLPGNDAQFGYTYPVAQYDHDEGSAIVGAGVYRGSDIPPLVGKYVFGDIVNGRIFYTDAAALVNGTQAPVYELVLVSGGQVVTLIQLVGSTRVDLRFGVDESGEMYALSKRDGVVRTLPEPAATAGLVAGTLVLCALRRRAARWSAVI